MDTSPSLNPEPEAASHRSADHGALLRQALRAVEQMQRKVDAAEAKVKHLAHQPIAIVGMGCRFPGGANDPESFWDLLREGREAITEVPADRWRIEDYYDPDPTMPGKMVSRFGGFLSEIDTFDAAYFGIAPREAAMMDPQQRLLLEVAIEALESSAIPSSSLIGTQTAVFLGMASGDYGQLQMQTGDAALLDLHFASGNAHSIASGRVAYLLGLKGPAVTLDTACSSSLVAVHLACQSLRTGDCTMAIAGGVNILLAPETTVALSHAHMLSPDGRSKAFDARADGFARAEGCGIVVLKTLSQAESDGDRILAIIRGSAVNQDGASSSLTAPNGLSQEALMRSALEDASIGSGVSASAIGYIEAHGTGTALGDPIELRALGAVYGAARQTDEPVLVGSLKSNFGHMEAAAGVGGLIKLVLALDHGQIPAHATIQTPTPHVPWDRLKLAVPASITAWPSLTGAAGKEPPRIGTVSSFGFSGTNAHLVVEQGPDPNVERSSNRSQDSPRLLPLSAKSSQALNVLTKQYETLLASPSLEYTWPEIAATAAAGRDHFRYRKAIVAANREDAIRLLKGVPLDVHAGPVPLTNPKSIGFLFTGQGSERSGMGIDLLAQSAVFRTSIERMDAALHQSLPISIATIWANESRELERASLVQPALYAYGWALSELWRSWGVEPRVVLGHSLGEYVAATVAGVMTPEEGIRLVAARGRLTEELGEPGGMLAVVASVDRIRPILAISTSLSMAAINGPSSVVLGGPLDSIRECEERLIGLGLRFKRLQTTHGFHSSALDGMLQAFEAEAAKVNWKVPESRWISNLTGMLADRRQPVDASYWRRHLRETVQFQSALGAAEAAGAGIFLELGTEPQLLALAEANGIAEERRIPSLRKGGAAGDLHKLLDAAARLYTSGADLNWKGLHLDGIADGKAMRKARLPSYPFERQRFWFTDAVSDNKRASGHKMSVHSLHPLLDSRLRTRSTSAIFHAHVNAQNPEHLGDHVLSGTRILPGAAYLEMALAACRLETSQNNWRALNVEFLEPCVFDQPRLIETVLYSVEDAIGRRRFEIASTDAKAAAKSIAADGEWRLHAAGLVEPVTGSRATGNSGGQTEFTRLQEGSAIHWDHERFYARLAAAGVGFGPAFRPVAQAWGSHYASLVELEILPQVLQSASQFGIHPVVLDACMQAVAALVESDEPTAPALPAAVESFELWGDPARLRFAQATMVSRQRRFVTVDVFGMDAEGNQILALKGLTLVVAAKAAREESFSGWLQEIVWQSLALPAASIESGRQVMILTSGTDLTPTALATSLAQIATSAGASVEVVAAHVDDPSEKLERWFSSHTASGSNRQICDLFFLSGAEVSALSPEASGKQILDWQQEVLGSMLTWTQALLEMDRLSECRIWLLSRGGCGPSTVAPEGATLAAFARSVRSEYVGSLATAVDMDPASSTEAEREGAESVRSLWQLTSTTLAPTSQYVLRDEQVLTPSLTPCALKPLDGAPLQEALEARRLHFPGTGLLEDLKPTTELRRTPGGCEVEIEIHAAALNFHEVLSALDPGHSLDIAPGGECSGVIVRVGPDVTRFEIGEEVVATTSGLLAEYATMTENRVWKKPAALNMESAATLIIPFLTARWSLEDAAQLQTGESILIHAGAGGVGLAAIQEAHRLGARVFATAGSDAKRAYLLSLGVEAVFDSRSTSFEQGILAATDQRGVDVVLNSLSGDKVAASMRILAPHGRFIELGEATILDPQQVAATRPDLRYEVVHVRTPLGAATPEVCAVIADILADVEAGCLQPLPWHRFALADAPEAFRFMAAGLHTGRVLLAPSIQDSNFRVLPAFPGFKYDGAYLVSGGLAGLGLEVVEWLARKGGGCVLALGRSEPAPETKARIAKLREGGVEVRAIRCDVSDDAALVDVLANIPDGFTLKGIFHCAGIWDNGALPNQTVAKYRNALSGKLAGAWNLHRLTRSCSLDCFVMFSSVAGTMGSRGQSNYATANAYLDALAHHRRQELGLPALSIDWGAWSEVGAAVRHGMAQRSGQTGAELISPPRGLDLLGRLLRESFTQVLASRVDWNKWAQHWPAETAANLDLLADLLPRTPSTIDRASTTANAAASNWKAQLLAAPPQRQKSLLAARVEQRVRTALSLGQGNPIDLARPLQEYGLDSLLSIELRNALSSDLATKLSATALFDYPTLGELTNWLFDDVLKLNAKPGSELASGNEAVQEANPEPSKDLLTGVASLSDEEVERLFHEKMAGPRK